MRNIKIAKKKLRFKMTAFDGNVGAAVKIVLGSGLATTFSSGGIEMNSTIFIRNSNDSIKSKLDTFKLAKK